MREISLSDAQSRLPQVVDQARAEHDPVYLTDHGRRIAVFIDAADFERLIELAEDALDIRAAQEAHEAIEAGEQTIPWEQVKADLGL